MGKTTLVKKLQDKSFKCNVNISTNGVDISTLILPRKSNSFISLFSKDPGIQFNVWDFGGQAVFHSTHRLFITPNAIYVILYDMSKPETITRVRYLLSRYLRSQSFLLLIRYWIEQIGSTNDTERTKPILIVGTHKDRLTKEECVQISSQVQQMYPVSSSTNTRHQIHGHFKLNIISGMKLINPSSQPTIFTLIFFAGETQELRERLVDLALNHPKIGIGRVLVPQALQSIMLKLQQVKGELYMNWTKYSALFTPVGIHPKNNSISIMTLNHHIRSQGDHSSATYSRMFSLA